MPIMVEREDQLSAASSADDELHQQQQQQQKGHQLSEGQSSANDAGLDQSDTMTQEDRPSPDSTSAQRSGGQSQGGHGMGNESFEGSSLGGQSSETPSPAMVEQHPTDPSANRIDPAKPSDLDGE